MSRRASEGASSVLSFTFLDVLMCTMGSLLLLLVLFGVIAKKARARQDGEESRISLAALTGPTATAPPGVSSDNNPADAVDPAELARQLEQVRTEQAKFEKLKAEAADRRRQEQDRIAHLEEHERRLEHELAELHMTLEALEATEKKQTVDQSSAESEVKRLKELVKETEERLSNMRKQGAGDKSYAIVPYKGKNGTYRRPVFVECTAEAVVIQPEGIRLTVEDFDGPLRSGNPLAAAIRAAHEELDGRATAAGKTDLPDAYPLLIVRPDGAAAYAAALDAIRSWDSDYGYEFVEADWKLKYSEPDPRLAQIMAHAVDEARQRQALLAKVAPKRYASRLSGSGAGMGGGAGGTGSGMGSNAGGSGGGAGFNELAYSGSGDGMGPHAARGSVGGDARNSLRGKSGGGGGNFADEFGPPTTNGTGGTGGTAGTGGKTGAGGSSVGTSGQGGSGGTGSSGAGMGGAGGANAQGSNSYDRYAAGRAQGAGSSTATGQGAGGDAEGTAAGGQAGGAVGSANGAAGGGAAGAASASGANSMAGGASGGASSGNASGGGSSSASSSGSSTGSSMGGGAASADAANAAGGTPELSYTMRNRSGSAADSRGANWANAEAKNHASAVTRPIKVVVDSQQISVLDDIASEQPAVITFKQPVDRVLDQLAISIQQRIRDWGLAGNNMYWRPTLVVSVAPGAERQAQRLAELLDNSGVDVHLPQATANAAQGGGRASR